ncbi:hypothetical protein BDQ17DRAFT_1342723 [Cyathus striatus]|nr:hypothetical protein BDQ17DRAFT_1342723 [Cyathus striatus]
MFIKSPFPSPPALPPTNVYNFLYNREDQKEWKDFTALIDSASGKKKLFSELKSDVQELGTALGAPTSQGGLGLNGDGGEIISIMGENSFEYITLIQSLLMITTPFALISSYSTSFELKHALKLSKATRIFVDETKDVGISSDKIYILRGHVKARKSVQDLIFSAWKNKIPPVGVRPVTKDTLAYLVFSSGTTGLPKGNQRSYSMMQVIVVGQVTATVHTLSSSSPFLRSAHVLPPLMIVPCTILLMTKWNIDTALHLFQVRLYRVSTLLLIPSVVVQLVNHPKIRQTDMSSVDMAGCGAAYLPTELGEKLSSSSLMMLLEAKVRYGLSECTIAALGQPTPGVLGIHVPTGSAGVLHPGMEARGGEVGEVWLRGDNIALGYWGDEKATRGHKFRVDEKGYFLYDTLKVSGSQVSPVEIENVPRAWIVLSDSGKKLGSAAVVKELDAWHQQRLSKYKWLRGGIEVVRRLVIPKLPTGKVLRRVLQDKYEKQKSRRVKSKL